MLLLTSAFEILTLCKKTGVVHRVRRDAPPYGPPAPAPYHPAPHHGPKGRVGPVYTFVKTDPQVSWIS